MNFIPVIDLADYSNEKPEKKIAFIKSIGDAYREVGFVSVKNHGITDGLIEDFYREVKAFFSLPDEIKISMRKLNSQGSVVILHSGRNMRREVQRAT